jgi:hypothetical protein
VKTKGGEIVLINVENEQHRKISEEKYKEV